MAQDGALCVTLIRNWLLSRMVVLPLAQPVFELDPSRRLLRTLDSGLAVWLVAARDLPSAARPATSPLWTSRLFYPCPSSNSKSPTKNVKAMSSGTKEKFDARSVDPTNARKGRSMD